LKSWGGSDWVK